MPAAIPPRTLSYGLSGGATPVALAVDGSGHLLAVIDGSVVAADVTVDNGSGASAVNVQDGGNSLTVDALTWPLPTGAATSAKQDTGNASLASIDGHVVKADTDHVTVTGALPAGAATIGKVDQGAGGASAWKVDGSAVTQPVSASSLPLPTGAATAAKQPALGTAGTASADVLTVQGKTGMTALVVDPSGVTSPVSAASLPLPSGASTSAKQPALGTAGTPSADVLTVQGAASMTALKTDGSAVTQPVSGTFWQATQPVSAASLPLPSGAATSAKQDTGNTSVASIDTKTPALGAATTANSRPVTIASDQTVPVSVAATVATQEKRSATSTVTKAAASAVQAVTLLAANASRIGALFYNDVGTAVKVKLGSGAAADDFSIQLAAGDSWTLPAPSVYTGIVTGIWLGLPIGNMRATELT